MADVGNIRYVFSHQRSINKKSADKKERTNCFIAYNSHSPRYGQGHPRQYEFLYKQIVKMDIQDQQGRQPSNPVKRQDSLLFLYFHTGLSTFLKPLRALEHADALSVHT